jgi:hypothetical protein
MGPICYALFLLFIIDVNTKKGSKELPFLDSNKKYYWIAAPGARLPEFVVQ